MCIVPKDNAPEVGVELNDAVNYEHLCNWIGRLASRYERNEVKLGELVDAIQEKRVEPYWHILNGKPWPFIYAWVGRGGRWEGSSHVRREIRLPSVQSVERAEDIPQSEYAADPVDLLDEAREAALIAEATKRAIAALTLFQRQVYQLREVDSWNTEIVAYLLDKSPSNIRRTFHVSQVRLLDLVKKEIECLLRE